MVTVDACDWSAPGRDRFTGDPVAAVARYNLPPDIAKTLQAKMARRAYDDIVTIERDRIYSDTADYSDLRSMHFGSNGKVCRTVSRARWSAISVERALIYTAGDYTIAVPTICGNVSLITRKEKPHDPWQPVIGGGGESSSYEGRDDPQRVGGTGISFRDGWRSDGGSRSETNIFNGGSSYGSVWGGFSSYTGGSGGGGGGSLTVVNQGDTFNSVVSKTTVTVIAWVNNFIVLGTPPIASAINEPPAWAMGFAGFGVLGFLARRRLRRG